MLDNGRAFGGDSQYFYNGYYELFGDKIRVEVKSQHYFGDSQTIFGDRSLIIHITAVGKIEGDQINGVIVRADKPEMTGGIHMVRRDRLP